MTTLSATHRVLVDFENVPGIDLGLVAGKPVHVTLLIGKNQGKIDFDLVEQIHRFADQVELVKLATSGHNALDLTLAYYLGQAVSQHPHTTFCIVSKDKDFEPMLGHLQAKGIKAARYDNFATLPFLPKSKKAGPTKPALPVNITPLPSEPEDRLKRLIARLKNNSAPRPKKKSSLLAHINTAFGGKLPETEQNQKLAELIARGILSLDAKDRVSYSAVHI